MQRISLASVSIELTPDVKWLRTPSLSYGEHRESFFLFRSERHVHPKRDSFFAMWFLMGDQSPRHQALLEATRA